MNKKAVVLTSTMVWVIAGVIALVALIQAVGGLRVIAEYLAGKSVCAAYSITTGAGGTECVHWVDLSKDNFTRFNKETAKRSIDVWHRDKKYEKTAEYFGQDHWKPSYDPNTEWILYEWLIDNAIAKEIKYCRDMGGLYSFQNWWTGIDETHAAPNEAKAYDIWFSQVDRPPVLCMLCARIKFDDELERMFREQRIESLAEWMKNMPAVTGKSFYEYALFEGTGALLEPRWYYYTNEPYAVVYSRIKSTAINRWLERGETLINTFGYDVELTKKGMDIHNIFLIPYSKYSENCDLPIG
ncbi:hypothetical protein KY360_00540 [Candidatus Woesearchaeota archaeon]|nr:hypothetical protein [Candidatus Woesearchaeota archaeon]